MPDLFRLSAILVTGAVLGLTGLVAQAADDAGAYAVDGVGRRSCADLVAAQDTKDTQLLAVFASWTDGFMTSYNILAPQTFDITPWQTVELTLAKMNVFCKANPDTPFIEGLGKLVATLQPGRLQTADELVLLRSGKQGIYMYRAMLPRIRGALEAAEIAVPSPEGAFDDAFARALKTFQSRKGLPESGLPDQQTLNALLR